MVAPIHAQSAANEAFMAASALPLRIGEEGRYGTIRSGSSDPVAVEGPRFPRTYEGTCFRFLVGFCRPQEGNSRELRVRLH